MRAKFMNERRLIDVNPSIVNKRFIDLQDQKNFLWPYVSDYMNDKNEFFDFEDRERTDEITVTKDFQDWLKYELEYQFEETKNKMEHLIDNGELTIFRTMSVSDDYLDRMAAGRIKRIGRYFASSLDKAEPHWGYDHRDEVTFEIRIKEEHVDWTDTIRLRLEHEFMNDEEEIRLFKNTPIEVSNVWWNDEEIDRQVLDKIKQNTYLS